jgi:hypothetical protein
MSKMVSVTDETVISKIYFVRSKKVMLDKDLAEMYGVETKVLNQAVKRNMSRFPEDFMFKLTEKENNSLRSQIVTLESGKGKHAKYSPYAFTEHGVAMLSSVLNSKTAIKVNIQIIRIFTRMREMLLTHKDILIKLEKLEKKMVIQSKNLKKHENEIQIIFKALKQLLNPPAQPRKQIGFKVKEN